MSLQSLDQQLWFCLDQQNLSPDAEEVIIFLLKKHQEMRFGLFFFSWKMSLETTWALDNEENLPVVQRAAITLDGFS